MTEKQKQNVLFIITNQLRYPTIYENDKLKAL